MPKWISQREKPSTSKRALTRTRYLSSLVADVDSHIKSYFKEYPSGETVTLYIMEKIGLERLESLVTNNSRVSTVLQDMGLLIILRLVYIYSPDFVHTYRSDDGKSVATKHAKFHGIDWLNKFTPHKIISKQQNEDRIVLDTNCLIELLKGSNKAIDLNQLKKLKKGHPISISDTAIFELLDIIHKGHQSWSSWTDIALTLNSVIDKKLPIAPSGIDACHMSKFISNNNSFDYHSYYCALWRRLVSIKNLHDIEKPFEYEDSIGQRFRMNGVDWNNLSKERDYRHHKWSNAVNRWGSSKLNLKAKDVVTTTEEIYQLQRKDLASLLTPQQLDRIDLYSRSIALLAARANLSKEPYVSKDLNDALDFDILFCVMYPGIICTEDRRMKAITSDSGSADKWRVMNGGDLIEFLSKKQDHQN